jgi:hypothetical protein
MNGKWELVCLGLKLWGWTQLSVVRTENYLISWYQYLKGKQSGAALPMKRKLLRRSSCGFLTQTVQYQSLVLWVYVRTCNVDSSAQTCSIAIFSYSSIINASIMQASKACYGDGFTFFFYNTGSGRETWRFPNNYNGVKSQVSLPNSAIRRELQQY